MTLFHLWDLPGDVLAAPESASGLDRCNLSLSLSLSLMQVLPGHPLADPIRETEGSGRVPGPVAARRAPREYPPIPCIPGSTGLPENERHGLTPIQPHRADAGAARTVP